jgi:hypothetical protein
MDDRMKPAKFDLTFYCEGVPVLVGKTDVFIPSHSRMEEVIVAQHRTTIYGNGYNFPIESAEPCFDDLYSMVLESVRHTHRQAFREELSISSTNKRTGWAFVLDENRPAVSVWHNHLGTSTYNAVYYLRANNGDAVDVIVPDDVSDLRTGREIELPVEEGMLLVMPNWLFHKPKPIEQRRGVVRISINMEVTQDQASVEDSLRQWLWWSRRSSHPAAF